jgi:hypothetical protein
MFRRGSGDQSGVRRPGNGWDNADSAIGPHPLVRQSAQVGDAKFERIGIAQVAVIHSVDGNEQQPAILSHCREARGKKECGNDLHVYRVYVKKTTPPIQVRCDHVTALTGPGIAKGRVTVNRRLSNTIETCGIHPTFI